MRSVKPARLFAIAVIVIGVSGCMDASLSQSARGPATLSILQAPSTIGNFDLTVSGPGMSDITVTVTPDTEAIVLDVPVGPDRQFDLVGFLNGDTTAFYQGLDTIGVGAAGVQVSLPMELRSKIVIPDDGGSTQRIVRLESVADGTDGWQSNTAGVPYDIDFDELGRIYVATSSVGLRQLNTFGQLTPTTIPTTATNLISVAIDRTNQWVYVAQSFSRTIYRLRYDGSNESTVNLDNLPSFENISGITVDDEGFLYIVQEDYLSKLNPDTGALAASFRYATYGSTPGESEDFGADVSYQNRSIYLLLRATEIRNTILQFDTDLSGIIDQYGSSGNFPANDPGEFEDPVRFAATLNRKITVLDAGDRRVISIDDLDGNGWTTFGSSGSSIGQFDFRFNDLPPIPFAGC